MAIVKSKVLIAVHQAHRNGRAVGAINLGAWPVAMSDKVISGDQESYEDLDGFWSLWESVASPEEFGMCIGGGGVIDGAGSESSWGGLWIYEVEWDSCEVNPDVDDCCDPDVWKHLQGGDFRRPRPDELLYVKSHACPHCLGHDGTTYYSDGTWRRPPSGAPDDDGDYGNWSGVLSRKCAAHGWVNLNQWQVIL